MQDHWIKDLSNYITDGLTTCKNGGLRQKSVYLYVFFLYDFPSFLTISLTLVNMQIIYICIWDESRVSKL